MYVTLCAHSSFFDLVIVVVKKSAMEKCASKSIRNKNEIHDLTVKTTIITSILTTITTIKVMIMIMLTMMLIIIMIVIIMFVIMIIGIMMMIIVMIIRMIRISTIQQTNKAII